MENLNKQPQSIMKVRFHDCDPFNHLNNSRYIDYFMSARSDQLLDYYGFDLNAFATEQGVGWVTAHTQISYAVPAVFMEEVLIETRLLSFSERSLFFEAVMYSKKRAHLKAVMWCRLVHFNLVGKTSQQHSSSLMDFFRKVADPLGEALSFDERVKELKSN